MINLFQLMGSISVDNKKANAEIDQTVDKSENAHSKMGAAFSKIGKGAAVVGKAVGAGMLAAGTAIGGLAIKALNLGGELEQNLGGSEAVFRDFSNAAKKLDLPESDLKKYYGTLKEGGGEVAAATQLARDYGYSMKDATDAIHTLDKTTIDFAGKMQGVGKTAFKDMGLSQSDFLATANKMGALFQGAGFGIEDSANLSSKAMQRAADVASIMGIETSAAMDAVAGAAKGNFTMMDNLGVAMNDTQIQAYAMSKGIKKSTQTMTQQEKIGLAMEMFLDKTAYAAGNYAKENETLAGSLGTAKAALTNFLAGSGTTDDLVTSLVGAANVITDRIGELLPRLVTGLSGLMTQLIPKIPPILQALLPGIITGAVALMTGLVAALPELINILTAQLPLLIDGLQKVFIALIDALPVLFQSIIDALPSLILLLIPALISVFVSLMSNFSKIISPIIERLPAIIMAIVDALMDNLPALIDGVIQLVVAIVAALPQILMALLDVIFRLISSILKGLWDALPVLLSGIGQIITSLFVSIWWNIIDPFIYKVKEFFKGLWEGIKEIFKPVIDWFNGIFDTIKTAVSAAWGAITAAFSAAWTAIKDVFTPVIEWFKGVFDSVVAVFHMVIDPWIEIIKRIWEEIKIFFQPIIDWFKAIFESVIAAFHAVVDPWIEQFKVMFEQVKAFISTIWTGIKDAFGAAWEGIKQIFIPVANFFSGIWDGIKGAFSAVTTWFGDIFSKAWQKVKDVFSTGGKIFDGIKDGIAGVFKTVVNGIIGGINKVISVPFNAINAMLAKIKEISIVGVKPFDWIRTFAVPQIPTLATGGVLKKGQTGYLEGEGDEAVVPLEKNDGWIDRLAEKLLVSQTKVDVRFPAQTQTQMESRPIIINIDKFINNRKQDVEAFADELMVIFEDKRRRENEVFS